MSCCRAATSSPVQQAPTRTVLITASTPATPAAMSAAAANARYLQPLKVGDFTLKNRVIFSACTRNRGNVPGALQAKYYAARASAGLILTEGTTPSIQGYQFFNAPGIYSQKQIAGWRQVTDAVHAAGGIIFNQLMHIGRVANPRFQGGQAPLAPSAIKAAGTPFKEDPRPWINSSGETVKLTGDHIEPEAIENVSVIVAEFRTALENLKEAGFDGVELHGANGYLISQFLDSSSNTRTDKYGGSPENRARFALELVDAAIAVFGSAGRVAIKISPEGGYNDQGMPREDAEATYGYLLKQLDQRKIAFVDLQRWMPGFDQTKRGTIIPTDVWRKYFKGTLFVGGNVSIEEGLEHFEAGRADAITFGRSLMANPDLVQRIADGNPLNGVDYATCYTAGEKGYTDYKAWSELSAEERTAVAAGYAGAQQYVAGERAQTKKLYEDQEAAAGRKPEEFN